MAAGEVFVMINGEIDLSIGAVYLFTPFVFYKFSHDAGIPLLPALILALLVAMLVGTFNGLVVAVVGISSFVATLGTLFTLDGLTLIISHATPVDDAGHERRQRSHVRPDLRRRHLLGAVLGDRDRGDPADRAVVHALGHLHGRRRRQPARGGRGRRSNARLVLIAQLRPVRRRSPASSESSRRCASSTATPDPSGSNDILFQAISAAVIGGTLLQGGSGTVVGALIGALFLGILRDGLIIKGVSANYFLFYLGLAILIAMTFNTYVSRVRTGSGRG